MNKARNLDFIANIVVSLFPGFDLSVLFTLDVVLRLELGICWFELSVTNSCKG